MPWQNTPEDRRRSAAVYGDPEYVRNRKIVRRRAGGRCEECRHAHSRLQCDHIVNVAGTGTPDHSLGNLRMVCAGAGTCRCHEKKTANEGGLRNRRSREPAMEQRTTW